MLLLLHNSKFTFFEEASVIKIVRPVTWMGKRNLATILNDCLPSSEMIGKLEEEKTKIEKQSSKLFFKKIKKPTLAYTSAKYTRETCGLR